MTERSRLLRQAMDQTKTSQAELSRISGVHQPSISQMLAGKIELSDKQLERLLSCMGLRLEVVRQVREPHLTRSERRSWKLHRQIARMLDQERLREWQPILARNLAHLKGGVRGQPHERNLKAWEDLIERSDLPELRRVLTALDRGSIEMREVSPMGGLLSSDDRLEVLGARASQ